jgi:protein SCO1
MTPTAQRGESLGRRPRVLLWGVLGMVLAGVVGFGAWSLVWQKPSQQLFPGVFAARLPIYGSVPDFTLTDQRGRSVRRADLAGKIWVASFIFTSCPDECPVMTAEMAQLQADLARVPDLRLVSISVDPEHDTPAALSQYADRFNADPERWLFLTGDKRLIYRLIREGFRLGIVDPEEPAQPSHGKDRPLSEGQRLWGWRSGHSVGETSAWTLVYHRWLRLVEPHAAFADHGRAKDPLHSTRFVLIDRQGQIRGSYDSREEAALRQLRQHIEMLIPEA